ncbi:MAG: hypothetical protein RLZZ427_1651 [Pseudomonadota bacterium]
MRSFDPDPGVTVIGPSGQRVHRRSVEQRARLERQLYAVRPGVWCLVGNGLSNQTFVEGPGGLIVIDTGESVEEMRAALVELRLHTQKPIVAVIYTHFHYVSGTRAVFDEVGGAVPVYGHHGISVNLARTGGEIAPAYASGLIHQFGIRLPDDGPDGLHDVGLGQTFRNLAHAPFTPGHAPTSVAWRGGETAEIAGLRVEVSHAPSDSDDSITLWFPDLRVAVQNLVWPTLFNIFAIRGEEYRNPQIVLRGIDHLLQLGCEHMIGTHGPPLSGVAEIAQRTTRYRDAIQFLWDQTVRGLNRGLTADQLAESVVLPASCDEDYLTSEFYGVAEHHVRQIAAGTRGWFDGDPAKLFPLAPAERAGRLVSGFGGPAAVHAQLRSARAANDLRWALELGSWLAARPGADAADRQAQADVLRDVAARTSAANIRNWCLTKARDIDGCTDLSRQRTHRLRVDALLAGTPHAALNLLRVLLDPARANGIDHHIAFRLDQHQTVGLHVRNSVAVVTNGAGAESTVELSWSDLAAFLAGQCELVDLADRSAVAITGNRAEIGRTLRCFDRGTQTKR